MKKLKFLLLGLLTASLAGALAACSQDSQTYTFTFDTRGGTQIEPLELKEGEAVTRPSDPTKQMFTFNDWYTDTTYSQVYSFGTMPAQDVTVYARWTPQTSVLIEYDSMGGTAVSPSVGQVGSTFARPDAPERTGYVFDGWFTDSECTQRYAFTVFPAENMTLYAGWRKDTANFAFITYYGNGKQLADPVPVPKGSSFAELDDKYKIVFGDDIVSDGWFTDEQRYFEYTPGVVDGELSLYTTYYTSGLSFEDGGVTGYTGSSQQVIVPDVNEHMPISYVGEGAFRAQNVTSVTLPDSIRQVSDYAFYDCQYLATVNLTANVTSVGEYAFANAKRLESYGTIGATAIPEGCFLGCAQLNEVVLPENTRTIGAQAFADCTSLTQIALPDTVTSVGAQAFDGCSLLENVALSASLTSLGEDAFANCPALTAVTVPEENTRFTLEDGNLYSGTQLVRYFAGEKGETSFTLPAGKRSVAAYAFENAPAITSVTFPVGTTLAAGALIGLDALESLTLPALDFGGNGYLAAAFGAREAETGGTSSFYIPATLAAVVFNTDVGSLADYAFYGATGLSSVTGMDSVTSIGNGAFAYTSVAAFEIPAGVRSFGSRVFEGCGIAAYAVAEGNTYYRVYDDCLYSTAGTLVAVPVDKTAVSFPEDFVVSAIGDYAFYGSAVTALEIPDSVTHIGFAALGNMQALTSLSVPVIGESAGGENDYMGYVFGSRMNIVTSTNSIFSTLSVSRASNLPANLKAIAVTKAYSEIPDKAFALLTGVTDVSVFAGEPATAVLSYGAFSFHHTSLEEWVFAGGTTAVGESAFRGTCLPEVSLPGTVGANAGIASFAEIRGLASIELGDGITQIPAAMFYTAYTSGEVSDDDGYTYNVQRSAVKELVIPESVTSIGSEAFRGVGMAEFWEPASPTQQPLAFVHGTRNEGFTITFEAGSALTSIGASAFYGCGAETLALPATVESVGLSAFENSLFLTEVTFGADGAGNESRLGELWAYGFAGCEKLASVTLYGVTTPPVYGLTADPDESPDAARAAVFGGNAEGFTVYVPEAAVSAYQSADGWKEITVSAIGSGTEGGNA